MKKRNFDFVSERMEMSRQYRDLTWEEFCLIFDCALLQLETPEAVGIFKPQLTSMVNNIATLVLTIKKINKK